MSSNQTVAFILSHGRPHNVKTLAALEKHGYTGPVYIVADTQDKHLDEYKKQYGKHLLVFNKEQERLKTDSGDNFEKLDTVLYARNKCFDLAKDMGYEYLWQLDDDYTSFYWAIDNNRGFISSGQEPIKNLSSVIECLKSYMDSANIEGLAFSQGGDFIGGDNAGMFKDYIAGKHFDRYARKVMNTFLLRSSSSVRFCGRMNDDVNTYVTSGNRGRLFLTLPKICVMQGATQQSEGGLTDMYKDAGTYVKSFYSVMYAPHCVKIAEVGHTYRRIHHRVKWVNAVPKVMAPEWKK